MPGILYLIPTPLGDGALDLVLPEETRRITARLGHFVVEQAKTARAFLKQIGTTIPLQQLVLNELNEHTPERDLRGLLAPLAEGHDLGLLSEAGCPSVADPGANLVRLAHQEGIRVIPLVGPSSILLALMASGLVGQRFSFHGYLPAKPDARLKALKELEKRAEREDAAQAFIETPYRNNAMLESVLTACRPTTLLCLACDLTLSSEMVITRCVGEWPQYKPDLNKRPCVFLIGAVHKA